MIREPQDLRNNNVVTFLGFLFISHTRLGSGEACNPEPPIDRDREEKRKEGRKGGREGERKGEKLAFSAKGQGRGSLVETYWGAPALAPHLGTRRWPSSFRAGLTPYVSLPSTQ